MGTRILEHPILGEIEKGKLVSFTYDGKKLQGYEGEPIAAALQASWSIAIQRKGMSREASSVPSEDARTVLW